MSPHQKTTKLRITPTPRPDQDHAGDHHGHFEIPLGARSKHTHRLRVIHDRVGKADDQKRDCREPRRRPPDDLLLACVMGCLPRVPPSAGLYCCRRFAALGVCGVAGRNRNFPSRSGGGLQKTCRQDQHHGTQECVRHVGGLGIEESAGLFSEEATRANRESGS